MDDPSLSREHTSGEGSYEFYNHLAKQGDAHAKFNAGQMLMCGRGVEQNYEAGFKLLKQAADQKEPDACRYLGDLHRFGFGVQQDYSAAIEWYTKAGDLGLARLGLMYALGEGVSIDSAAAMKKTQQAIAIGDSNGWTNYGLAYLHGQLFPQDEVKAAESFQKAAVGGDVAGLYYLGLAYKNGHGVSKDWVAAFKNFMQSAEKGNVLALEQLGQLYADGHGVDQDAVKSFEYFQKAAAMGSKSALITLGERHQEQKNYSSALDCFQKAGALGLINLAELYYHGDGVDQDYLKAMGYYTQALEEGDLSALCCLGNMYLTGEGVPRDRSRALEFFKRAVEELGDPEAWKDLSETYLPEKDGELKLNITGHCLNLTEVKITAPIMHCLATGLKGNFHVKSLILSCTRIEGANLRGLADVLKENPTLKLLDLSCNAYSIDADLNYFFSALKNNRGLESLNASYLITNESAPYFCDMIKTNTALKSITFGYRPFNDVSANLLVEALRQNKTLESFHLHPVSLNPKTISWAHLTQYSYQGFTGQNFLDLRAAFEAGSQSSLRTTSRGHAGSDQNLLIKEKQKRDIEIILCLNLLMPADEVSKTLLSFIGY